MQPTRENHDVRTTVVSYSRILVGKLYIANYCTGLSYIRTIRAS